VCVCVLDCLDIVIAKEFKKQHWHYCICLLSCFFSSIYLPFVFFFCLPNAITEYFLFKTKQPTEGISITMPNP